MSFIYRAIWPILDDTVTISTLIAEAAAAIDIMARRDGARLVGQVQWAIAGDRLVGEAPATPADAVRGSEDDLRRLAGLGWSDKQIGDALGMSSSWVAKRRKALGIPAQHQFGGRHPRLAGGAAWARA